MKKISRHLLIYILASMVILAGCGSTGNENVEITALTAKTSESGEEVIAESEGASSASSDRPESVRSASGISESQNETVTSDSSSDDPAEASPTPETADASTASENAQLKTTPAGNGHIVAIDPGHQGPNVDMSAPEPNGPGASVMKMKATSGTAGTTTGVGEYELNLNISQQLQQELETRGYQVVLCRTSNDQAISNAERAQLANQSGADVYLRIHANGSTDSSTRGALALIGSQSNPWVGSLYDDSYRLADSVLSSYCSATGLSNLGITTTDTMTGINWAEEPVMILEMGFMTNPDEDVLMEDADFQKNMVTGIANGLDAYFNNEQ